MKREEWNAVAITSIVGMFFCKFTGMWMFGWIPVTSFLVTVWRLNKRAD